MPNTLIITLSITPDYVKTLENLSNKSGFKHSKLFRMFLDFFNRNPDDFKKLIESDYDIN